MKWTLLKREKEFDLDLWGDDDEAIYFSITNVPFSAVSVVEPDDDPFDPFLVFKLSGCVVSVRQQLSLYDRYQLFRALGVAYD